MDIVRYNPSAVLKPFIKQYIFIESTEGIENYVLPDTAMVLAFRYAGQVIVSEGGDVNSLPLVVLSGIRNTSRVIKYSANAANLLVVFQPNGASAFFSIPLHEVFGQSIHAQYLKNYRDADSIAEQLAAIDNKPDKIHLVEQYLLSKLRLDSDALIAAALQKIQGSHGTVNVKQLLAEFSISRDAFEKRFRKSVGIQAKQFSSIIKLKNAISIYTRQNNLTELALLAGYYDQSHFIREFKHLTGQTPGHFFDSARYW